MPDFTNCKRLLGNAYAGANGKKIAIEYQGEQYMLKFPPSGQTKRTELDDILENEHDLHARIFRFPTSAIKYQDKKINYYDFLTAAEYEDCNEALLRIVPQIDLDAIHKFIDGVPYLTDLQRTFYKTYLKARYELIISPAYDIALHQKNSIGFSI